MDTICIIKLSFMLILSFVMKKEVLHEKKKKKSILISDFRLFDHTEFMHIRCNACQVCCLCRPSDGDKWKCSLQSLQLLLRHFTLQPQMSTSLWW